ncbi:UNVERIFIED_CONTAM: hypothetical protein FKN15_047637 [Acipenser sinensis]
MGKPATVRPPSQRQQWTICPPVANLFSQPRGAPKQASGAGGAEHFRSNSAITVPRWETADQIFPSAPSLPIVWNGDFFLLRGEGKERQSLRRMRKTVKTVSYLGTEPWGEDTATTLRG